MTHERRLVPPYNYPEKSRGDVRDLSEGSKLPNQYPGPSIRPNVGVGFSESQRDISNTSLENEGFSFPPDSPSLDSPSLDSPSLDSPSLDSPSLDSPSLNINPVFRVKSGRNYIDRESLENLKWSLAQRHYHYKYGVDWTGVRPEITHRQTLLEQAGY